MPVAAPRDLKIGMIVDETLGVLERCKVPALIFVVGLTLINGAATYFGLEYTTVTHQVAKGLFAFTVGVVAAYFLLEAMMRGTGFLAKDSDDAFLPFVVVSILYTLGMFAGLIALVLPGLFLMARWSVASPLVIVRGSGPVKAMKESWERTKGNEFPILIAIVILFGLLMAISIFVSWRLGQEDPVGIAITTLVSSATSLVGTAMGVALYGLIVAGSREARAFE